MTATELTFNDLPKVVGELCERIASMEICLETLLTVKVNQRRICTYL